jgi:hypothetical protein
MNPYRVAADVFGRGFAEEGEYTLVPNTWQVIQELLATGHVA